MPSDNFSRPTGGRKKLKRKSAPPIPGVAPVQAVKPSPTVAPKTDVQSSGSDYGKKKATVYTNSPKGKRVMGAAKPPRQTDATSSGPGYGKTKADTYRALAIEAIRDAKADKPFDPYFLEHAINLGLPEAKDWSVDDAGRVWFHKRRDLLPDSDVLVDPSKGGPKLDLKPDDVKATQAKMATDAVHAPVIKVLEQTVRPARAVAGLVEDGPSGFKKGLIDNKPYSFGKILKDAGAPAPVAAVGGFALDVVTDPTTYFSAGTISIARKEAERAALKAAEKAAKAGMSEAGQRNVAIAAAKKAVERATPGKGITVQFAGQRIPGVTTATAKTARGARKVARKAPAPVKRTAAGAKNVVTDVRPQMARSGENLAEHQGVRAAGRRARAEARSGAAEAERRARAARRLIPEDQYAAVIDAIERGKIGSLPGELQAPARALRDWFRYAKRLRRQAGVGEGEIGGKTSKLGPVPEEYRPVRRVGSSTVEAGVSTVEERLARHPELREAWGRYITLSNQDTNVGHALEEMDKLKPQLEPILRPDGYTLKLDHYAPVPVALRGTKRGRLTRTTVVERKASGEGGARQYFPHAMPEGKAAKGSTRKVTLGSSKKREDLRPISEQNPERAAKGDTLFDTNIPRVFGEYMVGTARAVAAKHLAARLADLGRPLKDGMTLADGDVVFHYHNGDLTPVKQMPKTAARNGRYVVLNRRTVDREFSNIAPQTDRTAIGELFDRGTAGFKRIATFTPGFHARNFVGDTQMAYLGQPAYKLPGNVRKAGKAVRRLSQIEHAQTRQLGKLAPTSETIKVAGRDVGLDEFVREAQKQGVIRSGYIGRELEELRGVGGSKPRVSRAAEARGRVSRWMQNREDLMRLATYKHGLDKGLSPSEAAEFSLGLHIDYGDLTKFERTTARRVAPFYTFSARALPIHAKALVTRPGKYANYEKLREEVALATGIDLQDSENDLKVFQARQAPLIMRINGKDVVVSDALPLTLLNELPANGLNAGYLDELAQWVGQLANPIIKDPVELYANKSFFFRSDLEPSHAPLVAAPGLIAKAIYDNNRALAKRLGIVPDYIDKKTGKKTWGWRAKTDYVFKSIPGALNFAQQLMTEGTNRRGMGTGAKVLSFVGGVKVEPLDPTGAAMELLFDTRDALEKAANSYTRREKTPANVKAAALLRAKQREAERQINKLSVKQGDQVPLYKNAAGRKATVGLDVRIAILTNRAEMMKARHQDGDEYGYYTAEYSRLRDRINELKQQRAERRGKTTETKRLKPRPLSGTERLDDRLQQQLDRLNNPDSNLEDKLNRQLERLKIASGG